jgi:Skp family chaperone for outer membrane proteins
MQAIFPAKKLLFSGALLLVACASSFAQGGKSKAAAPQGGAKLAYVNIDTLEVRCTFLAQKREEINQRHDRLEAEIDKSYEQLQKEEEALEKKMKGNRMTESESEAAQKRINSMQQSVENRKQELTDMISKDQEDFAASLKGSLNAFLDDYNKTWHYDCVLSYSSTDLRVLYVNKQLDITNDVVNGMNANPQKGVKKKNK